MSEPILKVDQLTVNVEDKEILHGINLTVNKGETHVLMGPNGAGKSTLGYVLMGNPRYQVSGGSINFKGNDVTKEGADKRAKEGMFLSFQEPLEVPGLSLEGFIRNAVRQQQGGKLKLWAFKKELEKDMGVLQMDEAYAERSLNVGFSGGEKKKAEILQLMMLKPSLAILDRLWSGCRCSSSCFRGCKGISEESGRCSADHHAQHKNSGCTSCRLHTRYGRRKNRGNW